MINATAAPQAVYTKVPTPPTGAGTNGKSGDSKRRRPKRKNLGRSIGIAVGLTSFLILLFAGAFITLRQRSSETTAPTATQASGACSMTFVVPPAEGETAFACEKIAYNNDLDVDSETLVSTNFTGATQQTDFEVGDIVVYEIEVQNTGDVAATFDMIDPFIDANTEYLEIIDFADSTGQGCTFVAGTGFVPGDAASQNGGDMINCTFTLDAGESETIAFRARISQDIPDNTTIVNTGYLAEDASVSEAAEYTCSIAVNVGEVVIPTPTPRPTPSPSPTPSTYSCNSTCQTDQNCQEVNASYVCVDDGTGTDRCRLDSNRGSASCTPVTNTYACNSNCTTNAQCETVGSAYICYEGNCRRSDNVSSASCKPPVTYTPPPTPVGCGFDCVSNSDCTNSAHICYQGECRLANYPNSATCQPPTTTVPPVPTKGEQPVLPSELPQSGIVEDTFKAAVVGVGAVVVGALAVLLLL